MKKYDVRIKSIRENTITVSARNKKEAIEKVDTLLCCTNIDRLEIRGQTKYSTILEVDKNPIFFKKKTSI